MYKLIAFLSAIIREFYLPNPYINFFNSEGLAELFNIFVGGIILHPLSFRLTGIYYKEVNAQFLDHLVICAVTL